MMRMSRLSWVAVSAAFALCISGGSAAAQTDEQATAEGGPFSASVADFLDADDMVWLPGPPHGRLVEWLMSLDVEASDPRLSGTWTMVQNGHGFGEPGSPDSFSVYTGAARLHNENGAWIGEVVDFYSEPYEHMRLVVEGEGGYAGLTAIIDQTDEFGEFQGVVFEHGLPPMPEAVEPASG